MINRQIKQHYYFTYVTYASYNSYFTYRTQEGDQWTAEPAPSCHRCPVSKVQFLNTDCPLAMKRTKDKRAAVTAAATGEGLRALGMTQ